MMVLSLLFAALAATAPTPTEYPVKTADFRVRDPFVVLDGGTYHLICAEPWFGGKGVNVLKSRDLENWTEPREVMKVPEKLGCSAVWAPEVHKYRGRWYLFVTLTLPEDAWPIKPMQIGNKRLGKLRPRGTWIFAADTLDGPFLPIRDGSVTPKEWMCLDGTLFVEDGKPYMVFCHEWCQVGDGRMMLAELSEDLTTIVGEPKELFRASSYGRGNITDGCFVYRSEVSGKLYMLWSNWGFGSYATFLKESESGRIAGPWKNAASLYENDGGHGMLFRKTDGSLNLAIHQPNRGKTERMMVLPVDDDGRILLTPCAKPVADVRN